MSEQKDAYEEYCNFWKGRMNEQEGINNWRACADELAEALEAVERPPYDDSDPDNLLKTLQVYAKKALARYNKLREVDDD